MQTTDYLRQSPFMERSACSELGLTAEWMAGKGANSGGYSWIVCNGRSVGIITTDGHVFAHSKDCGRPCRGGLEHHFHDVERFAEHFYLWLKGVKDGAGVN